MAALPNGFAQIQEDRIVELIATGIDEGEKSGTKRRGHLRPSSRSRRRSCATAARWMEAVATRKCRTRRRRLSTSQSSSSRNSVSFCGRMAGATHMKMLSGSASKSNSSSRPRSQNSQGQCAQKRQRKRECTSRALHSHRSAQSQPSSSCFLHAVLG